MSLPMSLLERAEAAEARVATVEGALRLMAQAYKTACDERDAALVATADWRERMVQREVAAHMRDSDAEIERLTVALAAASGQGAAQMDWTVDPKTGRANSSDLFKALSLRVGEIIRHSAHDLLRGNSDDVGALIVAQLAHVHGLKPAPGDLNEDLLRPTIQALRRWSDTLEHADEAKLTAYVRANWTASDLAIALYLNFATNSRVIDLTSRAKRGEFS